MIDVTSPCADCGHQMKNHCGGDPNSGLRLVLGPGEGRCIVEGCLSCPRFKLKCRKAGCNKEAIYPRCYPMTCVEHKSLGTGVAEANWVKIELEEAEKNKKKS